MKNDFTWENIVDILIQEFKDQKYKKEEKMPSENSMAVRFGVARSEIRRAYSQLKELGYIYSMQGYGSFFSGKKERIRLTMNDSKSFTEKMNLLGVHYQTKNMGFEVVKDNILISDMLEIPSEHAHFYNIYKLTLLRLIDNEPVAIHISYLPDYAFPNLSEKGHSIVSLYDYIKQCGYRDFKNENGELSVATLDKKERMLLNISGYAPSLVLSSKCIDHATGRILEIARTIYRSDKFIFTL